MGDGELDWGNVDVRRLRTGAVGRTEWETSCGEIRPNLEGRNAKEKEKELLPLVLLIILLFFARNS
jgi:hypothetical protein